MIACRGAQYRFKVTANTQGIDPFILFLSDRPILTEPAGSTSLDSMNLDGTIKWDLQCRLVHGTSKFRTRLEGSGSKRCDTVTSYQRGFQMVIAQLGEFPKVVNPIFHFDMLKIITSKVFSSFWSYARTISRESNKIALIAWKALSFISGNKDLEIIPSTWVVWNLDYWQCDPRYLDP